MNFVHQQFAVNSIRRPLLAVGMLAVVAPLAFSGFARAGDLTISPSAIENSYIGPIDLTVAGLDNAGQTVVIEEFFDSDASQTIGGGDLLVRKVRVTDGAVTSIAGQRNLNIPGDEDGAANQQIHTRLVYGSGEVLGRIPGRFIFRVSPASGSGFRPFTASLTVSQHNFGGSGISGQVVGGAPLVGQGGSIVVFVNANGDHGPAGITRTDSAGDYTLNLPPGTYLPIGIQTGFVFDTASGPVVTVSSGSFAAGQTLTLTSSQRTISGTVRDAVNLAGLPGLPMFCTASASGFVALAVTDANGNYSVDATAEQWELEADGRQVAQLGFMESGNVVESSSGTVTGFNIDLLRVTALIYGSVKTTAGVPVPFFDINSQTNGLPDYRTDSSSDANGNYTLGVTVGVWRVEPVASTEFLLQQHTVVVTNDATAVQQDLVAHPITAHLRGQIRDNLGNPVANMKILARDPTNNGSGNEINSHAVADANGNFDIGVYGGGSVPKTWQLSLLFTNEDTQNYVATLPTFSVQDGVDQNGIVYLAYIVTARLRGHVLDESNEPIGNIAIWADTTINGIRLLTSSNVDSNGSFDMPIFGGVWRLGLSNINGLGLLTPQDFHVTMVDGVDRNDFIFRAIHGTATIAGTLKSTTNVPIGGVTVSGSATNGESTYMSSGVTDVKGQYSFPVFSDTWNVSVDTNALAAQGYESVSSQDAFVPGGSVTVNFIATLSVPADLNGDGIVNGADLGALLSNWNNSGMGDINGDGIVNGADLGAILGAWTGV